VPGPAEMSTGPAVDVVLLMARSVGIGRFGFTVAFTTDVPTTVVGLDAETTVTVLVALPDPPATWVKLPSMVQAMVGPGAVPAPGGSVIGPNDVDPPAPGASTGLAGSETGPEAVAQVAGPVKIKPGGNVSLTFTPCAVVCVLASEI
jgi:hypothetical protein